jgi:hypothetical protein
MYLLEKTKLLPAIQRRQKKSGPVEGIGNKVSHAGKKV